MVLILVLRQGREEAVGDRRETLLHSLDQLGFLSSSNKQPNPVKRVQWRDLVKRQWEWGTD